MRDAARRADERLAAQGDVEAAGRALIARVRAGSLSLARLQVAACLGDPAARAGLSADTPPVAAVDPLLVGTPLALALAACGVLDCARVVAAALHALAPSDASREARELIHAFERWVDVPEDRAGAVLHALYEWERRADEVGSAGFRDALAATGDLVRWLDAPPDGQWRIDVAQVGPDGTPTTTTHRGTPAFEAGHAARDALCALIAQDPDGAAAWILPWLLAS